MPRHYGNAGLSRNHVQSTQFTTDPFGDVRVCARTNIIDIKSTYGVSTLRDKVTTTAGGTFTATGSEFQLQTSTGATDAVVVQTRECARYQAGFGAEQGMGIRIPASFAGQVAKWGLYDGTNGFYWQYDTDLSVNVIRAGVVTQVTRPNFNIDTLDGKGPSGLVLDMTRGNIFKVLFAWYGFGAIVFLMAMTDSDGSQCIVPVHQQAQPGQTSVATPHLPIRIELKNNTATQATTVYLSGRQFSIVGSYNPPERVTCCLLESAVTVPTSGFAPVMAIQRKSGYSGTNCVLRGLEFMLDKNDGVYQIITNVTVTGGTWTTPSYLDSNETALQVNTTMTSHSGGYVALMGILQNTVYMSSIDTKMIVLCQGDTMLVTCKAYGTAASMALMVARFTEHW